MYKKLISIFLLLFAVNAYAEPEQKPAVTTGKIPVTGTVALTFDDGPNPIYTPQILAILKKYNIKATFFVVGNNAQKYPEMIKAIRDAGHVVASHSMSHPQLTKLSDAQLKYEVVTPNIVVEKIIGIKPKCLRYPFGMSNHHVREVIAANGMIPTSMGFNSFDYDRPGTQKIVDWVLKNIYSKQVILLHDGFDKREQTVAALPQIIEGVQKKGLGFSAICA